MTMRAKLKVTNVQEFKEYNQERLTLIAVTNSPFDAEGLNEDNTFAKYTPQAEMTITIANPNLLGKFKIGQTFYLDFSEANGGEAASEASSQ